MEWHPKSRSKKVASAERLVVRDHPLRPFCVTVTEQKLNSCNDIRTTGKPPPKPVATSWGGIDPLSAALKESNINTNVDYSAAKSKPKQFDTVVNDYIEDDFEQWSVKKSQILSKYTTSERLSIKTSFLVGGSAAGSSSSSIRNLQNTSVAEKVKHRLEQLDDFEEGSVKEMLNLTQQDYVCRIEELNAALRESWEQDQRVKALKIVIQCAKLLADVSVIQFYPSKYVLVTEILDNFGVFVYNRIHCKAETNTALESAKETCRNWFYKVASIRELIPRLYVEAAILKTYGFIAEKNVKIENIRALRRLLKMARGIGDPLVAMYAKAYLCRVTVKIVPAEKSLFKQVLSDFFLTVKQFDTTLVRNILSSQKVDYSTYLTLYSPTLDWILQCIVYKASDSLLCEILTDFDTKTMSGDDSGVYALLLNSIITSFRPSFITKRAKKFVEMVKLVSSNDQMELTFPKHQLLKNLGTCFVSDENGWIDVDEQHKLILLNEVWKMIARLKPSEYIICADVWMDFVVTHFGIREINTLLRDIVKHMQPDRAFENHYNHILSIIGKVVKFSTNDFSAFFSMESFIPFLDLLQKESIKVEACKMIVEFFVKNFTSTSEDDFVTTSDPVILNSMMYLCKTMHDSVNALTLEDEKRQISSYIVDFLRLVSFEKDFEAYLNFMVESRANFSNLEPVILFLVHSVNQTAMKTRSIVKGHHTKKTTAFVRTCLAYCFITIPSLEDVFIRLQLYLNSAQVALVNTCLPQTDAFLKAAIMLLPQVPPSIELSDGRSKSTEQFFITYIANLLSFLIIVPDHPEQEPLYLLCGLLNVVEDYSFDSYSDIKLRIYLDILSYLSVISLENYPYHIDKVDSNDVLYGNSKQFMDKIQELSTVAIENILAHLKKLGDEKQLKRQGNLALETFYRVITFGDETKMTKLASNLLQLALKNVSAEVKQSVLKCKRVQQFQKMRRVE
ncbi:UPF0505 protein C16orf62-like protein [Leptotrombidium deliense]|uniref:UPF0505 protein C16orf62-like protein n=1 Tax=Leptotrombidium deliense TaxID=299467 RepID=A0A443SHN1_9ACAR|nr:UPF0505 protein C16orf62-like protein [Leptotrombidium deliense]